MEKYIGQPRQLRENLVYSSHGNFSQAFGSLESAVCESQQPVLFTDLDGVFNDDRILSDYSRLRIYPDRLASLASLAVNRADMAVRVVTARMIDFNWGQDWKGDLQNALAPEQPETVAIKQLNSASDFTQITQDTLPHRTIITGAGKRRRERLMLHAARPLTGKYVPGGNRIHSNMLQDGLSGMIANTPGDIFVLDGSFDMLPAFAEMSLRYPERNLRYFSVELPDDHVSRQLRQIMMAMAAGFILSTALYDFRRGQ